MSGLTTHILDLSHGQPASNVLVELYALESSSKKWKLITSAKTNHDGRLNSPLLYADNFQNGTYELVFHIGAYFQQKEITLPNPPFLDTIPVRFNISDVSSHYHVPLLISPWGYQIYRGS